MLRKRDFNLHYSSLGLIESDYCFNLPLPDKIRLRLNIHFKKIIVIIRKQKHFPQKNLADSEAK